MKNKFNLIPEYYRRSAKKTLRSFAPTAVIAACTVFYAVLSGTVLYRVTKENDDARSASGAEAEKLLLLTKRYEKLNAENSYWQKLISAEDASAPVSRTLAVALRDLPESARMERFDADAENCHMEITFHDAAAIALYINSLKNTPYAPFRVTDSKASKGVRVYKLHGKRKNEKNI